jgi:hypothetical protein
MAFVPAYSVTNAGCLLSVAQPKKFICEIRINQRLAVALSVAGTAERISHLLGSFYQKKRYFCA